ITNMAERGTLTPATLPTINFKSSGEIKLEATLDFDTQLQTEVRKTCKIRMAGEQASKELSVVNGKAHLKPFREWLKAKILAGLVEKKVVAVSGQVQTHEPKFRMNDEEQKLLLDHFVEF